MKYPSEFSIAARNVVEHAKISAYRQCEQSKMSAQYRSDLEKLVSEVVLRIFLAFAREACALGRRETKPWPLDRIDQECREFLRLITIDARYHFGMPSTCSRVTGALSAEIERVYHESPQWQEYDSLLERVAAPREQVLPVARKRPGPKPDLGTARRVTEIVERIAPGRWSENLGEICEALDEAQVPPPRCWSKLGINTWSDAACYERARTRKAIEHHVANDRRR